MICDCDGLCGICLWFGVVTGCFGVVLGELGWCLVCLELVLSFGVVAWIVVLGDCWLRVVLI